MKKTIIAGASVLALAGAVMPMAGVFAAADDVTTFSDTLRITVDETCSFTDDNSGSVSNNTYADTVKNGETTDFDGANVTTFNVVCNANGGWKVTSGAAGNLSGAVSGNNHVISYTTGTLPTTGEEGSWAASVSGDNATVSVLPAAGGIIAQQAAATDSSTFTVTYSAYVGSETAADTYTGTVSYTLAKL